MDETIYVIVKVLFDFALEVWFSIEVPYSNELAQMCLDYFQVKNLRKSNP